MKKVTLIVGEQGIGKTTLANALANAIVIHSFDNKRCYVFEGFDATTQEKLQHIKEEDEAIICL